jgi:septal ring factor EnvC (AmiA/AmiB activator)
MSDVRSSLSIVNRLASVNAKPVGADASVANAVVQNSVDISAVKADLEKFKTELSSYKAKLADLETCILALDSSLASMQRDNITALVSKLSVADSQVALVDRVSKVESLHSKLSSAFSA